MKEKVFCRQCRYYVNNAIDELCLHSERIIDSPTHQFKSYDRCTDLNRNNDCEYFEEPLFCKFLDKIFGVKK